MLGVSFLFPRKEALDLDLDSQPLSPSSSPHPPLFDRGADIIVRIVSPRQRWHRDESKSQGRVHRLVTNR